MNNDSDVGLVDAHTKGIGGHHDAYGIVLPVALTTILIGMVQSGMIEGGRESCFRQVFGYLAGMATTAHIDDG